MTSEPVVIQPDRNAGAKARLKAGGTTVPGAYELYLQGRGYLQRYELIKNIDTAIDLFEKAVEEDSMFVLAYAGLGEAFMRKYTATREPRWVEPAIKQAEYAVSLDDELAPVRVSLGIIYLRTGRHEEAITEFRHALILEQNHTDALLGLAQAYEKNQELDRAESMYRQAIQSKPDYWSGYNKFGLFYFNQGRYEDAKEQFEQIIKRK